MIYTNALLQELAGLSDHQLKEIGLDKLCLQYSLQEIEDTLSCLNEKIRQSKAATR